MDQLAHKINRTEKKQRHLKPVANDLAKVIDAISRIQAIIEFNLDGTIITANENFLKTLGYNLDEIKDRHHKIFCDSEYASTSAYKIFWDKLNRGEPDAGEYKRIGKNGKEVWINASYNPIFDANGKPCKVIKFATDITKEKLSNAEFEGKIAAISKTQAIIEFNLDGTVITANENFLNTLGYSLNEIQGQHHRLFCDSQYVNGIDYKLFWDKLKKGIFDNGEYKRIGKNGKEVWINASYNPIFDANGKPYKVVKFATDITEQKNKSIENNAKIEAIGKVQAVIEFNLDGSVIFANDNFLKTLGYSMEEIKGKHHRLFCDSSYTQSSEYRLFWDKLNRGEFDAGEYKRISKNGKEVWINASYNPIFNADGKVVKVIKYASDITKMKDMIKSIEETASALGSASSELMATATQMSATASKTNVESQSAGAMTVQIAQGVQTVATNTEEMVASIKEIARSASESSNMAKSTLTKAQQTNTTIAQLGESSQEIGDVIKVINSIAQQTNLLALNATIEAARAGEAGKGFAVVANEVKELAKQTAKATNDIANKIGAIQKDTQNAVEAIGIIATDVEKLNNISGTIAVAVEEQTATTNEVSRIMLESKIGVEKISNTVSSVAQAANESTIASQQTLSASKELAKLADRLNNLVGITK